MIEPPIMLPIVTGSRLLCVDEAQAITYGRYRRVTRRAYRRSYRSGYAAAACDPVAAGYGY
jgi:hypothetical protein